MSRPTATPTRSEQILSEVEEKYGFRPNLMKEFAKAPAVARVYLGAQEALQEASLTQKEQNAVMLAVANHNDCHYCKAVHSAVGRQTGLSAEEIQAILDEQELEDDRLSTLLDAARRIVRKEGWLDAGDLEELENRGVDRPQIYEIVALVGLKTISNYVNHIAETEIDPQFR